MGSVQEAEPELEPWYVQGVGIRVFFKYVFLKSFSVFQDGTTVPRRALGPENAATRQQKGNLSAVPLAQAQPEPQALSQWGDSWRSEQLKP